MILGNAHDTAKEKKVTNMNLGKTNDLAISFRMIAADCSVVFRHGEKSNRRKHKWVYTFEGTANAKLCTPIKESVTKMQPF